MKEETFDLTEKPIAFYPQLSRYLGNDIEAAIYLQQILFWSDKGTRKDGFIYKTKADFEVETTLSRKQQDRIRKKLTRLGLIEVKKVKANSAPTLHFKPIISLILRISTKGTNALVPKGPMDKSQRDQSIYNVITENTTENTTPLTTSMEASPHGDMPTGISQTENPIESATDIKADSGRTVSEARTVSDMTMSLSAGGRPEIEYGNADINWVIESFEGRFGFASQGRARFDRICAKHLLDNFSKEQIGAMMVFCVTNQFAPRIGSVEKLWYKRGDIIAGIKKMQSSPPLAVNL